MHWPQGHKKEDSLNMEMRHSFQRRNTGQCAIPGTAMWIAQWLAEEKPEQQKGILGLWVHPGWGKEVSEQPTEEINGLLDEDALEALNELQQLKKYIQKQSLKWWVEYFSKKILCDFESDNLKSFSFILHLMIIFHQS